MLLVLPAAGYSGRLGIQKQTLKLSNGHYMFEEIIRRFNPEKVFITTNQVNEDWWREWVAHADITPFCIYQDIQLFTEPHNEKNRGDEQWGPLRALTEVVPVHYPDEKNIVVATIDSYYSNYNFLRAFQDNEPGYYENEILYSRYIYPEYINQMGVVKVKVEYKSGDGIVKEFVEKPPQPDSGAFVFAALFRTSSDTLRKIGPIADAANKRNNLNFGEIVNLMMKMDTVGAIRHNGDYIDVGNPTIYNRMLDEGILQGDRL